MAETSALYVCRPSDSAALRSYFDAASNGSLQMVLLEAPLGGGKRAVVGDMIRNLPSATAADGSQQPGVGEILIARAAFTDEEDGLRCLLNLYAAIYGALYRDAVLKGKVEVTLNQQIPNHPRRVQQWFQAFVEGLKKGGPAEGDKTFQLTIPRDNPLIGLVEILAGIASKVPVVLEIQNIHNSHSISTFAFLEALLEKKDSKLLVLVESEPVDDSARAWMPAPWLDLIDRRGSEFQRLSLVPWGADEVSAYLASKNYNAARPDRIAEIAHGRPAFVAELSDWLNEQDRLGEDLEGASLATLAPTAIDEDDLDIPTKPAEGGRKYATAADASRILYVAASLGLSFPSGLVADMSGYDRESVDDLLDACEDLVKELQFSKPLGSWVYQFSKAIWRQGVLDAHRSDEDKQVGQRVGMFMERFLVPRGYEFVVKTLRMYADHGAPDRAAAMRGAALSADRPDIWAMTQDGLQYYSNVQWPDNMRRAIYGNLLDRMVQGGDPDQAEKLYQDALAWAKSRQDIGMEGWVYFAGSRLDFRRQDTYRGRDRAKDALRVFTGREDKLKIAEVHNHLALIEFTDGSNNAAMDHLRLALETANVPPIKANVEFIRGLISRKSNKVDEAVEHFKAANELAGNIGMAPLALESGFQYGEALFVRKDYIKAADVLMRVSEIARALQNPMRERAAMALLAESQGALNNHEAALQSASRTLQLTQELKFEQAMPGDIFRVGFFNLRLGRPTEAVSLFNKAKERAGQDNPVFLKELSFNLGIAYTQIGERGSASLALRDALNLGKQVKDWRRVMQAAEQMAALDMQRGDKAAAKRLLEEALNAAELGKFQEEQKTIRRRLKEVSG